MPHSGKTQGTLGHEATSGQENFGAGTAGKGGLKVVSPAVLMGLGILAASAAAPVHAGPALDDVYSTPLNTPLTGVNVTTNDSPFGNSYSVSIVTPVDPAAGTATLEADGELTFTPVTGFAGTASLSYRLLDGSAAPNTVADVTITVTAPPAPPPPTPVPTLAPLAVGGLGALVALLGARRRQAQKDSENDPKSDSDKN